MVSNFLELKLVNANSSFPKVKSCSAYNSGPLFGVPTLTDIVMLLSLSTHTENYWSISESLIRYFSVIDLLEPSIQHICVVS